MVASGRVTSTNYDRPYRPALVAAANRLGRLLGRTGLLQADLGEQSLLHAARRKTGLDDFGDPTFRLRLRILLDSVEKEARLHPLGRFMARENFIRVLGGRLRIEEAFRRRPEILAHGIEDPVFIIGLQRTGTTVLHRLLATDPALRFLASWEAVNPAPLSLDGKGDPEQRIKGARMAQRAVMYLAPDFFAIHPVEALAPEEDVLLLDYDFWSTVPEATQRLPTFSAWLERQDHTEGYRYYGKILQYLHWQRPGGRWLLKSPHHMEHIGEILEVFPKARIIMPHRDPARVLASFCSMEAHAYGIFSDEVDPFEVGRHWLAKTTRMVRLAVEAREKAGPEHFIDVAYADLVADPLAQMRRVYDFLGLELTAQKEEAMRSWIAGNPQHKHGKHRYRLEDFGLDGQTVEKAFADYRRRFDIPIEAGT
jgi:hypothetical protein